MDALRYIKKCIYQDLVNVVQLGVWGYVTFFGSVFIIKADQGTENNLVYAVILALLLCQCGLFLISQRGVGRFTRDMLFATRDNWSTPFDYSKVLTSPSSTSSIAHHRHVEEVDQPANGEPSRYRQPRGVINSPQEHRLHGTSTTTNTLPGTTGVRASPSPLLAASDGIESSSTPLLQSPSSVESAYSTDSQRQGSSVNDRDLESGHTLQHPGSDTSPFETDCNDDEDGLEDMPSPEFRASAANTDDRKKRNTRREKPLLSPSLPPM